MEKIATGPDDQLGLGPGFERDGRVTSILQTLKGIPGDPHQAAKAGFPGRGERVLLASLRSRATRNRFMALGALAEWPQSALTPALYSAISAAAETDPDQETRELAETLMRQFTAPMTH